MISMVYNRQDFRKVIASCDDQYSTNYIKKIARSIKLEQQAEHPDFLIKTIEELSSILNDPKQQPQFRMKAHKIVIYLVMLADPFVYQLIIEKGLYDCIKNHCVWNLKAKWTHRGETFFINTPSYQKGNGNQKQNIEILGSKFIIFCLQTVLVLAKWLPCLMEDQNQPSYFAQCHEALLTKGVSFPEQAELIFYNQSKIEAIEQRIKMVEKEVYGSSMRSSLKADSHSLMLEMNSKRFNTGTNFRKWKLTSSAASFQPKQQSMNATQNKNSHAGFKKSKEFLMKSYPSRSFKEDSVLFLPKFTQNITQKPKISPSKYRQTHHVQKQNIQLKDELRFLRIQNEQLKRKNQQYVIDVRGMKQDYREKIDELQSQNHKMKNTLHNVKSRFQVSEQERPHQFFQMNKANPSQFKNKNHDSEMQQIMSLRQTMREKHQKIVQLEQRITDLEVELSKYRRKQLQTNSRPYSTNQNSDSRAYTRQNNISHLKQQKVTKLNLHLMDKQVSKCRSQQNFYSDKEMTRLKTQNNVLRENLLTYCVQSEEFKLQPTNNYAFQAFQSLQRAKPTKQYQKDPRPEMASNINTREHALFQPYLSNLPHEQRTRLKKAMLKDKELLLKNTDIQIGCITQLISDQPKESSHRTNKTHSIIVKIAFVVTNVSNQDFHHFQLSLLHHNKELKIACKPSLKQQISIFEGQQVKFELLITVLNTNFRQLIGKIRYRTRNSEEDNKLVVLLPLCRFKLMKQSVLTPVCPRVKSNKIQRVFIADKRTAPNLDRIKEYFKEIYENIDRNHVKTLSMKLEFLKKKFYVQIGQVDHNIRVSIQYENGQMLIAQSLLQEFSFMLGKE